ncbi:MAG: type I-E CRISPR-associated protein Cas7/Cse4/CasC [Spirochaetes bacterium]|nr:type I-E CRISPR-associated protein Cas7/Cse4/CasC [Spirochaetota bacterium]MBU1079921.1 type I-E CRISPR-associated protein Cas7/Cse4/CasC [Spirochaetota bacterium]
MNLILDTHIIQSYPVSNLNRDDTGSPKDCIVGGSRRARVSSQCVKRSIRLHPAFATRVERAGGDVGVRTKFLLNELSNELTNRGLDAETAKTAANAGILALGFGFDKKNADKTQYLLYLGKREIVELAELLMNADKREAVMAAAAKTDKKSKSGDDSEGDNEKSKKGLDLDKNLKNEFSAIIGSHRKDHKGYAADIALFGRMIADDKDMNVDGASQVAHAISTHRVDTTFDYYTAVDDKNTADAGAGMLGIQEYNSACYYRYANVCASALLEGLGGDAAMATAALVGFAEAAVLAVPSGKQHSTAAATRPSYIRFVVRRDSAPLSFAGAFSQEIRPTHNGEPSIEKLSIEALKTHRDRLAKVYGSDDLALDIEIDVTDDSSPSLADALARLEQTLSAEFGA